MIAYLGFVMNDSGAPGDSGGNMKKKYIHYWDKSIYALYYRSNHTLYINLNFKGKLKLYIYK